MRSESRFLFICPFLFLFAVTAFAQNSDEKARADRGLRRIDTQSSRPRHIDVQIDEKLLDATIEKAVSLAMRSLDVTLSRMDIRLAPISVSLPEIDVDIEPINIVLPEINIDVEPIEIEIPEIEK